jgi:hypothetical protein
MATQSSVPVHSPTVPPPGTGLPPLPPEGDAGPRRQPGSARLPWMRDALPLVTSLVAHAAVVALGVVFFAVTVVSRERPALSIQQVVVPESATGLSDDRQGVPDVGANEDPTKAMTRDQPADDATPDGSSAKAGPAVEPSGDGGGAGEPHAVPPLTVGESGGRGGGHGFGAAGGAGDGGKGGPLARFGPPGGGAGAGPKGVVFGNNGGARRIVFLCDATGTMIGKMGGLKAELQRAVDNLLPFQAFNLVFYTDGGRVLMADKAGLMVASAENKRRAFEWLGEVTASGATDPVPAIEATFKLQPTPDLIYFLSDGEFNNLRSYEEVAAAVARGAAGRRVKVNTILFETYEREAEKVMERMAFNNKGVYRYVREQDLR